MVPAPPASMRSTTASAAAEAAALVRRGSAAIDYLLWCMGGVVRATLNEDRVFRFHEFLAFGAPIPNSALATNLGLRQHRLSGHLGHLLLRGLNDGLLAPA